MFLIPSREFHQTKAGLGNKQLVGKPTKPSLLPPADLQHLRLPFFTSTLLCNISLLSSWATNYFFTSPTILSSTLPRPSHAFCQLQIFLIYQNLTQLRYWRNILILIYDSCFASFQWSINPNQSSLRNTGFNQRKNTLYARLMSIYN